MNNTVLVVSYLLLALASMSACSNDVSEECEHEGFVQQRYRFLKNISTWEEGCPHEIQQRTCQSKKWTEWSGSLIEEYCYIDPKTAPCASHSLEECEQDESCMQIFADKYNPEKNCRVEDLYAGCMLKSPNMACGQSIEFMSDPAGDCWMFYNTCIPVQYYYLYSVCNHELIFYSAACE